MKTDEWTKMKKLEFEEETETENDQFHLKYYLSNILQRQNVSFTKNCFKITLTYIIFYN